MFNILVTGGAGFLGSHLCRTLLDSGNMVTVIDNLYTGNIKNLDSLFKNRNFNFIEGDITVPLKFDNNFDQIFNLACPASPPHYQKNPLNTMQSSVYGAFNILNFALKNNSKILQASTSEVYGDPKIHPQSEEYFGNVNPNGTRSCYDEGKRAAESIFFDFNRINNLPIKVVRIFNTFGPQMNSNDGRVISNFITQALNGSEISIYGDGTQTRCFCYVSDMIEGLINVMNLDNSFKGPINLGTDQEFPILSIAKKILDIIPSNSKISFKPLPFDDPVKRKPDLSLAKKTINWKPKVSLYDGLLKTIEYFKES